METKGLECVFSSDIDKDVQEAYKRNFGDKPYGDITKISENKISKHRDDVILDKTLVEKQLKPIRIGQVNKGGQGEKIYSPFGHSITLSAFGGGVGARTGLYYINDKKTINQ